MMTWACCRCPGTAPCSGHGSCDAGKCVCDAEWKGQVRAPACDARRPRFSECHVHILRRARLSAPPPPRASRARASCAAVRRAACAPTWTRGRARASTGGRSVSQCYAGPPPYLWGMVSLGRVHHPRQGSDCTKELCPKGCSGNGFCTDSGCACYPHYKVCTRTYGHQPASRPAVPPVSTTYRPTTTYRPARTTRARRARSPTARTAAPATASAARASARAREGTWAPTARASSRPRAGDTRTMFRSGVG